MSWTRIAMATAASGAVTWISDGLLHGVVMAPTYQRLNQVFTQTEANPVSFLVVNLAICVTMAMLFVRTRPSWPEGLKGGVTFGFFVGLVLFFQRFFDPLVVDGFPAYLAWCEGGIAMIDSLLAGAALGAVLKE
jgi:hypothetical protein